MRKLFLILLVALMVIHASLATEAVQKIEIKDPAILNNIGYHLYQKGHLLAAETFFLGALTIDDDYVKARENSAITLNKLGLYEKASNELLKLIKKDPENVQYWYDLGVNKIAQFRESKSSLKEFYEGYDAYKKAYAIDSSYAHVRENLEVLDRIRGEFGI